MPLALLDTNVFVHAVYVESPVHMHARRLVECALSRPGVFCIAPQNLVEFAAVVSRRQVVDTLMPRTDLASFLLTLYRSRRLKKIYPRRATVARTAREGSSLGVMGATWYDLFLAATMRDAGVGRIVTEDRAHFGRIPFVTAVGIREQSENL